MDSGSDGLLMANIRRSTREERTEQSRRPVKRNDVLPDDVLLEIFNFYVIRSPFDGGKGGIEAWQILVHVCRQWRRLVFRSPRRLNLRLLCTPETPAKDTLDVWPALPLLVRGDIASWAPSSRTDNIITALGQSNRVCQVLLGGWRLEKVLAAMQAPFPELTDLQLESNDETLPVIPDSFLGGSAPGLRILTLRGIPFPGLPKPLWSSTHLVSLSLENIPHSGYISPEAIVTLLSALSSLRTLTLEFQSPRSRPDWQSPSQAPPKRSILPALKEFHFKGVTEYLEELVSGIDTPHLHEMNVTFFNQINFDCPRLAQFIICTPTLRALDKARVLFRGNAARVELRYRQRTSQSGLKMAISCREQDWQLSSIEQVCNSSLHTISTLEDLYIECRYLGLVWNNDVIENTLWLQLLLPFTTVKNLYISEEFALGIAAALKELVGDRTLEVLPSLQNIFVEELDPSGPFQINNIRQFVAARRLSDHPITISDWDMTL